MVLYVPQPWRNAGENYLRLFFFITIPIHFKTNSGLPLLIFYD